MKEKADGMKVTRVTMPLRAIRFYSDFCTAISLILMHMKVKYAHNTVLFCKILCFVHCVYLLHFFYQERIERIKRRIEKVESAQNQIFMFNILSVIYNTYMY